MVDHVASPATERFAAPGARVVIAEAASGRLFPGASDLMVSPGFAPHDARRRAGRLQ